MARLQNDSLNKHWPNGSSGRVQVCVAHQLPGFVWIIHILVSQFRKQKKAKSYAGMRILCVVKEWQKCDYIWALVGKMQEMQGREWLYATQMF